MTVQDRHSMTWVRMRCARTSNAMVATFRRTSAVWNLEATEPQSGSGAPAGSLGLSGTFGVAGTYRGCPYCQADSFCRCGVCGEIGCWNASARRYDCPLWQWRADR